MKLIDLLTSPWAILPEKLLEIQAIYATHLRGDKIDIEAIEARLGRPLASEQQDYRIEQGGVAVLSVSGVISNKANMFTRISGGASAQLLTQQVSSMRADPRVRSAVIDWDTPGGSVFGIPAFAAEVAALAQEKPTVSVSTGMMASAGYWVGSAANAIFMSGETDHLGSIGVLGTHSYTPNRPGEQITEITAGKYKRIASDKQPLTEEGRAYLQAQVDEIYRAFVDKVAEHRGISAEQVLERMADGRVFIGKQALDAGLADGIATVETMVDRLATDPTKYASRRKAVFAAAALPPAAGAAAGADVPTPQVDEPVLPVASTTDPKGQSMTPQEAAAKFAAENPQACEVLRAEGATAERARIVAVQAQGMPGHEPLIQTLMFDGKSTAGDAAQAVLAAERKKTADAAAALANDAPTPAKPAAAPTPGTEATAPAPAPTQKVPAGFSSVSTESARIDAAAKAYMAKNAGVSYVQAVKVVQQQGA